MGRSDPNSRIPPTFHAVLDVGSFKTVCLVARLGAGGDARIVGVGHAPSAGVSSGMVVDLAAAERAISSAIADAERMAGIRLTEIDVAISGARLHSIAFQAGVDVGGRVEGHHVSRVRQAAYAYAERGGQHLLQCIEFGFGLDRQGQVRDPMGLSAQRLSGDFHAILADRPAVSNLGYILERCYLAPGHFVAGPLASALAVTTGEERAAGVLVLDIGAGVTGLAAYAGQRCIYAAALPVGGSHVTLDIAHALRTPLEEAERIKTLYGRVVTAQSDLHDVFSYQGLEDEDGASQRSTKADLARIIQARLAALLEAVRDRLAAAGLEDHASGPVVVTGGTSQMPGLVPFAEGILKRPVRDGQPHRISGLPPLLSSAGFAGVVGMLDVRTQSDTRVLPGRDAEPSLGYLGQVGRWLKEGF